MDFDRHTDFDFKTVNELPEEHSPKMTPCPYCSKPIPTDSLFCLYCGEPVSSSRKNKWVVLVALFALIALLFWIFIPFLRQGGVGLR